MVTILLKIVASTSMQQVKALVKVLKQLVALHLPQPQAAYLAILDQLLAMTTLRYYLYLLDVVLLCHHLRRRHRGDPILARRQLLKWRNGKKLPLQIVPDQL